MQCELLLKRFSTAHMTAYWLFLSLSMAMTVVPAVATSTDDDVRAKAIVGRDTTMTTKPMASVTPKIMEDTGKREGKGHSM